jgi:hypothetical protein
MPRFVFDNGSDIKTCFEFEKKFGPVVENLQPHYPRKEMLYYPNVWRAYWFIKRLLEGGPYEKVIYIATDAYILSQRLADYIEGLDSGWTALWSPKYNFSEPCIQVITHCKEFEEFFAGECDPFKYNGQVEECVLPFTHIEKGFVGDRYGEFEPPNLYNPDMDYYTQVPDSFDWDDSVFPVLRRVDGKIQVRRLAP